MVDSTVEESMPVNACPAEACPQKRKFVTIDESNACNTCIRVSEEATMRRRVWLLIGLDIASQNEAERINAFFCTRNMLDLREANAFLATLEL